MSNHTCLDAWSPKFHFWTPQILLYLLLQKSHPSETNVGCNLLCPMILWCCCVNVFRSRHVDRDDFMVFIHLRCKKSTARWGLWSCDVHVMTKPAKCHLHHQQQRKNDFSNYPKQNSHTKFTFTSRVRMPKPFAQFNGNTLLVFEPTPHSSTGKTGTHLSRLHISNNRHCLKTFLWFYCFFYTWKEHVFLFSFEPTYKQEVGSNNQDVRCAGLHNTLLTLSLRIGFSANLCNPRVSITPFSALNRRDVGEWQCTLWCSSSRMISSCQNWLHYDLGQPCRHGWACSAWFCSSVVY